jgi:acetyl-CoA carboxylase biotin carboxyl carrier protein
MGEKTYTITSPIMGTFYRSSAPGEKALVEEGQAITTSDIVCMIESMKIFTELRCEQSGIVKKILVENEDPVMKNQALMEIEPN